jgi:hypothetical protein
MESEGEESRLSDVGKLYDVNGDGKLDEAEQAMRDMDETGRGYLTNEKVYELMLEHNKTQKSLFKLKKVVAILGVFVVLLTICNLGTSIAAAYLAKDTTINEKNELVNMDTNEPISTQSMAEDFNYVRAYNETEGQRRLCDKASNGEYICDTASYLELPLDEGSRMIKKCKKGETVNLRRTWHDGSETLISMCPTRKGSYSQAQSRFQNGIRMSISGNGLFYVLTGDDLVQELDDVCDETNDCASGLVCMDDQEAIDGCKKICDRLRFGPSKLQPCYDACVFRSCQTSSAEARN